jgi:hypothetical protein
MDGGIIGSIGVVCSDAPLLPWMEGSLEGSRYIDSFPAVVCLGSLLYLSVIGLFIFSSLHHSIRAFMSVCMHSGLHAVYWLLCVLRSTELTWLSGFIAYITCMHSIHPCTCLHFSSIVSHHMPTCACRDLGSANLISQCSLSVLESVKAVCKILFLFLPCCLLPKSMTHRCSYLIYHRAPSQDPSLLQSFLSSMPQSYRRNMCNAFLSRAFEVWRAFLTFDWPNDLRMYFRAEFGWMHGLVSLECWC